MRLPRNFSFIVIFLLVIAAIIAIVKWAPIPAEYIIYACMLPALALVIFTFLKYFNVFLHARADGILEVYEDAGKTGVHIFAYRINSGGRYASFSTRDIQHYFIVYHTGKLYYKRLLSHSMKPTAGRSGWGGFSSVQENIIQTGILEKYFGKLLSRSGVALQLGEKFEEKATNQYVINTSGYNITIEKFDQALDEGLRVICKDVKENMVKWSYKI